MNNNHPIFAQQSRPSVLSVLLFTLCAIVAGLASNQAHAGSCGVREAFCLAAAQKPAFPTSAIYNLLLSDDPTCNDHMKNGRETDVDCGGGDCPACGTSKTCAQGSDCLSFVCSNGHCAAAACNDNIKNGSETDVDCGGGTCSACAVGLVCVQGTDCSSLVCSNGHCAAPACNDNVKNGNETDVDCGGNNLCPRCAVGQQCLFSSDCQIGSCVNNLCTP